MRFWLLRGGHHQLIRFHGYKSVEDRQDLRLPVSILVPFVLQVLQFLTTSNSSTVLRDCI